jgi:hypothetical protein
LLVGMGGVAVAIMVVVHVCCLHRDLGWVHGHKSARNWVRVQGLHK